MNKEELKGYMEFTSRLPDDKLSIELPELLEAADDTQIRTFGWPIGVVMQNDPYRPKPSENGIRALIDDRVDGVGALDYWTLHTDGTFYILKTLFEDRRSQGKIFLDTRVIRTAEVFLRTARLYEALGVPTDHRMSCRIEYGGLKDRLLVAANPMAFIPIKRQCSVNSVEKMIHRPIGEILAPAGLKDVVYEVVRNICVRCDFFEPDRTVVVDRLVDGFLQGRVL